MTRRRLTLSDYAELGPEVEMTTIAGAAQTVDVHPKLVREWVQGGHVRYDVVGGRVVVPLCDVTRRERDTRHHKARKGGRPRRAVGTTKAGNPV